MSKLGKKGATSTLLVRGERPKGLTTVKGKLKTSYNIPPLTMRMSLADKNNVSEWVEDLQEMTTRKVSPAKLMRALVEYRENIDDEVLIKIIDKMN